MRGWAVVFRSGRSGYRRPAYPWVKPDAAEAFLVRVAEWMTGWRVVVLPRLERLVQVQV